MKKLIITIFLIILLFTLGCEKDDITNIDDKPTATITTADKDYSIRFGINGGLYSDGEDRKELNSLKRELDDIGYIWLRHIGKAAWFDIQSERGVWDWSLFDNVLLDDKHPWIIEIFGSTGTVYPLGDFSSEDMRAIPQSGGSKNDIMDYVKATSIDFDDPQQLADTEEYVKLFVTRYKDQVKYWEISNEGINAPNRADAIRYSYQWIKEVHPDAIIMVTGVAGTTDSMLNNGIETMDLLLEQGLGDYFDLGNFHHYGLIQDDFEKQLEDAYDAYQGVFDKHGIDKPIWVTETGTSSAEDSTLSGPSSEELQAQHVVKRLVVFSAKGAEKVFWHSYGATHEDNKFYQCNIVHPDTREPKPSFYTFKLIVEKIGYFETVETLRTDDVRLYKFTNPDDKIVYVAWTPTDPQTVDLSEYINSENVLVTHIIETRESNKAEREEMQTNNVDLTISPIFIEEI